MSTSALSPSAPTSPAAAPTTRRNLVTQQDAARHFKVTDKTIRNWISKGLIAGYRLPGGRAVRVDLNEAERVMNRIPTTVARPGRAAFGPRARIHDLSNAIEPAGGWSSDRQ